METLSLYELNRLIRLTLHRGLSNAYWVQAELSEVREAYNGHCYIELVQKSEQGNTFVAKARGTIWANIYKMLKPYFENTTGQRFVAGIKVLLQVSVDFHEQYGLSLTVHDIDPTYTLGDMARRRREILMQLESEGVLTLNKELSMPMLPQRVAVVSAAGAAGYGDFCDQLMHNPYGFVFYPRLFPAVMQGDRVEESVIAALDSIISDDTQWDVVVIIRGGGATSDLSGFDTYLLATNCAQFPLPIITGIGHERDDTVLDVVAHTRVKTPTAAAEFLIARLVDAADALNAQVEALAHVVNMRMRSEEQRLTQIAAQLPYLFSLAHTRQMHRIEQLESHLRTSLKQLMVNEVHRLQLIEQVTESASPQLMLQRGYSITRCNGKVVRDASILSPGVLLTTEFADGMVQSEVRTPQN
jgi:exodeoxyribonuclease VII large subunit